MVKEVNEHSRMRKGSFLADTHISNVFISQLSLSLSF